MSEYDFEEEERQTYQEIRIDAMESAYSSCRNIINGINRGYFKPNPEVSIFGHFFDEDFTLYDNTIDSDIIRLCHCTLDLILRHGLGPELANNQCTRIIKEVLSRNSFEELSQYMSEEEVADLGKDLRLLKFID
jgi:septin family protein